MSLDEGMEYSQDFEGPSNEASLQHPDISDDILAGNISVSEEKGLEDYQSSEDRNRVDAAYALLERVDIEEEAHVAAEAKDSKLSIDLTAIPGTPSKKLQKSALQSPASAPNLNKGGHSPVAACDQRHPAAPASTEVSSSMPSLRQTKTDMRLHRNSLEFALTQKPFMDVGLRYAMHNVERITGSSSASAAFEASMLDAVAGGSSYYGGNGNGSSSIMPRTEVPPAESPHVGPGQNELPREDEEAPAMEVPEPTPKQQYNTYAHQASPPKSDPLRSTRRRDKQQKVDIAGFVSEPWKASAGMAGYGEEEKEAQNLIESLEEGDTRSMRVTEGLAGALQQQTRNRHMEDVGTLVPTAATLVHKKVLNPVKFGGKHSRTSGGRRRSNSASRVGVEEYVLEECLSLAATQAEMQKSLKKQIQAQLLDARRKVQEKLTEDAEVELRREGRVLEFVEKTYDAKKRIKAMQSQKGNDIAAKESDKQAYREAMLAQQAQERAQASLKKRQAAKERKEKISMTFKEKNREMEETVLAKLAQSTAALKEKDEMRRSEHEKRALEREQKIQEKVVYAAELEMKKTSERAYVLDEKEKRFERTSMMRDEVLTETTNRRKVKDTMLSFRAEQRRMMLEAKKKAEMELGKIRQTQEAVIAAVRRKTDAQRPIKLHAIYAEQLRKQHAESKGEEDSLDTTPGPGEYFKNITKKISPGGGYMASSRPETMYSDVPGPGHYSNAEPSGTGTGCIPFMSRGLTDVDVLTRRASKLPGVGQYNVSKKGRSGRSVKLTSKGTTQLDRIIDNASKLPGPGDYNLSQEATHKPGSMEAYLLGECDAIV